MDGAIQQAPQPARHCMSDMVRLSGRRSHLPMGNARPMSAHQTVYKLRNHPARKFSIAASVTEERADGAVISATIKEEGKSAEFTYVVEFGGAFTETKRHFTGEMYLHTALSLMQSQLESLKHRSTLMKVYRTSGLTETAPLNA